MFQCDFNTIHVTVLQIRRSFLTLVLYTTMAVNITGNTCTSVATSICSVQIKVLIIDFVELEMQLENIYNAS